MGANIGTTVTAWLFALSFGGGSFSLGTIAVPLMFIAFICLSSKTRGFRHFGDFLMGFALLFLGLTTLRETSTLLLDNEPVRVFLSHLTGAGAWSIVLFMIIGAAMTLMLQSSAATMAITMVLVANGYIPFIIAAAMVLGENIGTTITSNIAASVANVSAKRTARAHMLFNLFGVLWVSCLFHPFLGLIGRIVTLFGFPNPYVNDFGTADPATKEALVASLPYVVATLHTLFNVINTLILIWFVPQIEKIVTWLVPNPKGEEEVFRLKYIKMGALGTAELSLKEAQQEIVHFGQICRNGLGYVREAIEAKDEDAFNQYNEKLIKYEDITDHIEREIASYLEEVSKARVGSTTLGRIRGCYRIIGEMESLGDAGESIGKIIQRAYEHEKKFTPQMLEHLGKMVSLVDKAYEEMITNLQIPIHEIENIDNAYAAEREINAYRDILRRDHLANIGKSDYAYDTGAFYMDLVVELEKMGDFIINISESLMDEKNS